MMGDAEGPLRYVKHSISVFPQCVLLVQWVSRSGGHYHRRLQDPSNYRRALDGTGGLRRSFACEIKSNVVLVFRRVAAFGM